MSNSSYLIKFLNNKPGVEMDTLLLRKSAIILRAVNHKLRQQILIFIDSKGTTMVTEIYEALKIEQSLASQHLAVLKTAGMVLTNRKGKNIYYSLNYKKLQNVSSAIEALLV